MAMAKTRPANALPPASVSWIRRSLVNCSQVMPMAAITPPTRAVLTTRNTATPSTAAATWTTPSEPDGTAMPRLTASPSPAATSTCPALHADFTGARGCAPPPGQPQPRRDQHLPGVERRLHRRPAADNLGQGGGRRQSAQGEDRRHEQREDDEEALIDVRGLGFAAPEYDQRPEPVRQHQHTRRRGHDPLAFGDRSVGRLEQDRRD